MRSRPACLWTATDPPCLEQWLRPMRRPSDPRERAPRLFRRNIPPHRPLCRRQGPLPAKHRPLLFHSPRHSKRRRLVRTPIHGHGATRGGRLSLISKIPRIRHLSRRPSPPAPHRPSGSAPHKMRALLLPISRRESRRRASRLPRCGAERRHRRHERQIGACRRRHRCFRVRVARRHAPRSPAGPRSRHVHSALGPPPVARRLHIPVELHTPTYEFVHGAAPCDAAHCGSGSNQGASRRLTQSGWTMGPMMAQAAHATAAVRAPR